MRQAVTTHGWYAQAAVEKRALARAVVEELRRDAATTRNAFMRRVYLAAAERKVAELRAAKRKFLAATPSS